MRYTGRQAEIPRSPMPDGNNNNPAASLLSPGEPPPFKVINPLAETPILFVCDHASCRFPQSLGDMGLDPFARRCHLAIDIGAGPLTERLAESLGITAVLTRYSRLVVDCNRQLLDPGAFLEFGDGPAIGARYRSRAASRSPTRRNWKRPRTTTPIWRRSKNA